ncbi:MAG: sugar phosphate nucleotidyltransferase [Candidatus Nanohalobium sp.]
MFPFSETLPTPLMPVAGKAVVKHVIEALRDNGIDEVYLVTNHLEELFETEFGERTDVNIVHQENLEGTASAVKTCNFIEDDFIVVNGDVIASGQDLNRLIDKFRETGRASMLATYENRPEKFGVLSIENDEVKSIEEKPEEPENPLINTGIYAFTSRIFDRIEDLEEDQKSITDAVQKMAEEDGAYFVIAEDYWIDIGSGEKLWEADRVKRNSSIDSTSIHETAEVSEEAFIEGEVVIGQEAVVEPGACIKGRCYIGDGCRIKSGTVVKDSTVMGQTQLDQCSVQDSLLFHGNILDAFTAVEDAVIAEDCDVKPGTVIRESLIGAESFVESNNTVLGTKFVPEARTDIGEICK